MLSEKIAALRRKNGLSQEQLAEKLGVSRQAVSKWEGGLSVPELDKLRALSECFQITLDELTENQTASAPGGEAEKPETPAPRGTKESGVRLCLAGAVCLILLGLLAVFRPASVDRIEESSTVTLNGMGILMALFVLLMVWGAVLILRKK